MISSLFSRPVAALGILTPLLLSACGYSIGANSLGPCPKVGVLQDVAQMPIQRGGADSAVEAVATIAASATECVYDSSGGSSGRPTKITFDLNITARAARSSSSSLRSTKAPYFIAIFGPDNKLLSNRNETLDLSLSNQGEAKTEKFSITLPIPADLPTAEGYRVTAGFRLSQQQLATNRDLLGF